MDARKVRVGLGPKAAASAVLVGIVLASIVGLDEWADEATTHRTSTTPTAPIEAPPPRA